jgi:hypothetical protein
MYARTHHHRVEISKKDIGLKRRSTSAILFTQNFQSPDLLSERIKLNKGNVEVCETSSHLRAYLTASLPTQVLVLQTAMKILFRRHCKSVVVEQRRLRRTARNPVN